MLRKNIYTILSLPSFIFASACTTTQPSLDQSNIYRSDRVVHSKDVNTKRGSVQTRSAVKSSIAPDTRSGVSSALSSGAGTQRGQRKPVSTAATSQRRAIVGSAMGLGAANAAPAGLYDFCTRLPQSCAMEPPRFVRAAETRRETTNTNDGFMLASHRSDQRGYSMPRDVQPSYSSAQRVLPIMPIAWTPKNKKLVNRINRQINAAMIGTTDALAFGRQEFWTMPLSAPDRPRGRSKPLADCEDFALEKRKALIAAGIPEDALYLAVAVSEWTGLHAVLVISTDEGDLVLDNMSEWLVEWSKTNYVWIKRQASTSLFDWVIAGDRTAPRLPNTLPQQPQFQQENPLILASLDVVPAQETELSTAQALSARQGAEFGSAMASVTPVAISDATTIPLGLRGFSSDRAPAFIPAWKATSGVALSSEAALLRLKTNSWDKLNQSRTKSVGLGEAGPGFGKKSVEAKSSDQKSDQKHELVKSGEKYTSLWVIKAQAKIQSAVSYASIKLPPDSIYQMAALNLDTRNNPREQSLQLKAASEGAFELSLSVTVRPPSDPVQFRSTQIGTLVGYDQEQLADFARPPITLDGIRRMGWSSDPLGRVMASLD